MMGLSATISQLVKRFAGWGRHCVTPGLVDRESGKEINEPVPYHDEVELGLFYQSWLGDVWLWTCIVRVYFRLRGMWTGWRYNRRRSAKSIESFSKLYKVNTNEVERPLHEYKTLNEFFSRRLKPDARPIACADDPRVAVSPADSRALVFDTVTQATRLWIKGKDFSISKLLGSQYNPAEWEECSVIINRLSPSDYHRLHSPVTGRVKAIERIGSTLYAVEAAAITSPIDVYTSNERAIIVFDTASFGEVAFCIIGASQVGSCNVVTEEGQVIRKGQEVGFFTYGGSATLTLFRKGRIAWDADLKKNSSLLIETKVKMGQSIGSCV